LWYELVIALALCGGREKEKPESVGNMLFFALSPTLVGEGMGGGAWITGRLFARSPGDQWKGKTRGMGKARWLSTLPVQAWAAGAAARKAKGSARGRRCMVPPALN